VRSDAEDLAGQVIDERFEIRALLGEGGMGKVYRAWQRSVGREVAIKLIDRAYSRDPMAVRRFLREAKLASRLSQPNTVSVFDFGQAEDGRLFMAMELIEGKTLLDVRRKDGPFTLGRTVRVGEQLCDALDAAHALSIIHRDLKLENIIVLDQPAGRDRVKILDFGLAKLVGESGSHATDTGIVVGTPRYMAPEIAMGQAATSAADMYSLGIILAELVVGKPLYDPELSLPGLVAAKLDPTPILKQVPASMYKLMAALLDPEPSTRPSASDARTQLAQAETSSAPIRVDAIAPEAEPTKQLTPVTPAPSEAIAPPKRSSGMWISGLVLAVVAAAAIYIVAAKQHADPAPPAQPVALPPPIDAAVPVDAPPPPPSIDASTKILLHIKTTPSHKRVAVDGVDVGESPIDWLVEPGKHTISSAIWKQVVDVEHEMPVTIKIPLIRQPAGSDDSKVPF
jgi:serine/threonine-protein kinase